MGRRGYSLPGKRNTTEKIRGVRAHSESLGGRQRHDGSRSQNKNHDKGRRRSFLLGTGRNGGGNLERQGTSSRRTKGKYGRRQGMNRSSRGHKRRRYRGSTSRLSITDSESDGYDDELPSSSSSETSGYLQMTSSDDEKGIRRSHMERSRERWAGGWRHPWRSTARALRWGRGRRADREESTEVEHPEVAEVEMSCGWVLVSASKSNRKVKTGDARNGYLLYAETVRAWEQCFRNLGDVANISVPCMTSRPTLEYISKNVGSVNVQL